MAKSADENKPTGGDSPKSGAAAQPAAPQQRPLEVDESNFVKSYANFCRVTLGREELIVDFGMNAQPIGTAVDKPIPIDQRIIVNYSTAKRLLAALATAVQRYDAIMESIRKQQEQQQQQPPQT